MQLMQTHHVTPRAGLVRLVCFPCPQCLAPYLRAKGWSIERLELTTPAGFPWMASDAQPDACVEDDILDVRDVLALGH